MPCRYRRKATHRVLPDGYTMQRIWLHAVLPENALPGTRQSRPSTKESLQRYGLVPFDMAGHHPDLEGMGKMGVFGDEAIDEALQVARADDQRSP